MPLGKPGPLLSRGAGAGGWHSLSSCHRATDTSCPQSGLTLEAHGLPGMPQQCSAQTGIRLVKPHLCDIFFLLRGRVDSTKPSKQSPRAAYVPLPPVLSATEGPGSWDAPVGSCPRGREWGATSAGSEAGCPRGIGVVGQRCVNKRVALHGLAQPCESVQEPEARRDPMAALSRVREFPWLL